MSSWLMRAGECLVEESVDLRVALVETQAGPDPLLQCVEGSCKLLAQRVEMVRGDCSNIYIRAS